MDITTIGGIIFGIALMAFAVISTEGIEGVKAFWDLPAFLLVFGGTFAALLVNFPLSRVIGVIKVLKKVLRAEEEDTSEIITTFVKFSHKSRTEGFLSLEEDIKTLKNDFLKRGIQLVIDGSDQEFIRTMLETELGFISERHRVGREMFTALGTYSPAFGIIGTVLGMILMLRTLSDPSKVSGMMAIALVAAFYGLGAGYLLFLPMAGKLGRRSEEELFIKEIIIRGVLLLQSGASPSVIESNLKAYLEPAERTKLGAKKGTGSSEAPSSSPTA